MTPNSHSPRVRRRWSRPCTHFTSNDDGPNSTFTSYTMVATLTSRSFHVQEVGERIPTVTFGETGGIMSRRYIDDGEEWTGKMTPGPLEG